jgi:aminopeptidase-like protein
MAYSDGLLEPLFDELYPICRSIAGPGLRRSLDILGRFLPLQRESIASGSAVFDWQAPPEWHVRTGRLTGPDGRVVADFRDHNLHLVSYSEPVDVRLPLTRLQPHLHSLPQLPDAIPYATSYYHRNWGFCLPHRVRQALPDGEYHAYIDSAFLDGAVDYGHCLLPGDSEAEILLSSYLCHPSMANNELSGPLVLLGLYHRLARWNDRRYSYRFLLNSETIGALCFLSRHHRHLAGHMAGGMVLTCLGGDAARLSYKLSRGGDSILDRVMRHLAAQGLVQTHPFTPLHGSDERQYGAPGFKLPMGNIARSRYGSYPGYHNSLDDKAFMGIDTLVRSIDEIEGILRQVEIGGRFLNRQPYGEPHLSRRGLYPTLSNAQNRRRSTDELEDQRAQLNRILTVLSYSDGEASMVDIADAARLRLQDLAPVVRQLERAGLLAACLPPRERGEPR